MPRRKSSPSVVVGVEFSAAARAHDDGWLRAAVRTHVGELVEVDEAPTRRLIAFADPQAADAFCAAVIHDGRFDLVRSSPEIPAARSGEAIADPAVAPRPV